MINTNKTDNKVKDDHFMLKPLFDDLSFVKPLKGSLLAISPVKYERFAAKFYACFYIG